MLVAHEVSHEHFAPPFSVRGYERRNEVEWARGHLILSKPIFNLRLGDLGADAQ
jgi:hypothetical protein